jgi:hypothetical protein
MPTVVYSDCTDCCPEDCIDTDCCDCVPLTLYGTFDPPFDDLGTVEFTYNAGTEEWEFSGVAPACSDQTIEMFFYCTAGSDPDFLFDISVGGNPRSVGGGVVSSCDPFEAALNNPIQDCAPVASLSGTMTETAPP